MDIRLGDILTMKKGHPCGSKDWRFCASAWISDSNAWAVDIRL